MKQRNPSKQNSPNKTRKQTKSKSKQLYPKKYIPKNLTKKQKLMQKTELNKSRKLYKKSKYYRRKSIPNTTTRKSSHITNAKQIYNVSSLKPSKELAKKTGCSIDALNKIVNKGAGAYYSSGSRINQTPESWGYARLASSISGGKSSAIDYHILQEGCTSKSKALNLANTAKRKYKQGKRKVPKILI